jgi:hypothetical protein
MIVEYTLNICINMDRIRKNVNEGKISLDLNNSKIIKNVQFWESEQFLLIVGFKYEFSK